MGIDLVSIYDLISNKILEYLKSNNLKYDLKKEKKHIESINKNIVNITMEREKKKFVF